MKQSAVKRATAKDIITKIQKLLLKYKEGTSDFGTAKDLVQRSIMLCGNSDDRREVFEYVQDVFVNESLPAHDWHADCRPVPLFPLIIRVWPDLGNTDKLCRLILEPADYSKSPFSSVWARWKCYELNCSIRSEPLSFNKATLAFIRQRCGEIRSQIAPDASTYPTSIKDEIRRLASTVEDAEVKRVEHSIRMQETMSIRERREAIVRLHMRTRKDFQDKARLHVLAEDLDENEIPLPDMKRGKRLVPRSGTYADVFIHETKPQIWKKHIIADLQRDLSPRKQKQTT